MSELSENVSKIVGEIEGCISNEEERKIVKEKVLNLTTKLLNDFELISSQKEKRIDVIEEKERELESKIEQIQNIVDKIENDIYDDEDGTFDFEIVCPYCNNEFVIDLEDFEDIQNEIKCPECENIIELDWNEDEDECCSGHCEGCHECGTDENQDEDM